MRVTKTKKLFLYSLYVIFAGSFFIYYLFPSDTVREYLESKLNIPGSEFNISIAQVKPHFPPGLNLKTVGVFHKNTLLFDGSTWSPSPNFTSTRPWSMNSVMIENIFLLGAFP